MSLRNYFRNKIMAISVAFSSTEKNLFSQEGKSLEEETKQEQRRFQGTVLDSLVHGELTQEVKNLRWRTYKVLREMDNYKFSYSTDKNDDTIVKTEVVDKKTFIVKTRIDTYDDYELELVFENTGATLGIIESSHDNLSLKLHEAMTKNEKPLQIERTFIPKFYIENFTEKLNVRRIDAENKLLEFYVSKYPDEGNSKSSAFLNQIKKVIENGPSNYNFLQFDEVGFVTNQTAGLDDLLLYSYNNLTFDKIIDFNGKYVIKFKAQVLVNGEDLIKDYVEKELEEKYANKEKR